MSVFFFNMEQLNSLLELFDVSDASASSCEIFDDQKLCPNLLPFNGVNPRSVVIMGKVKLFATPTENFCSYDVDYFSVPCRVLNCLSF